MGQNGLLLHEALQSQDREQVVISVKFGALCDSAGGFAGTNGRPASVKNFLAYTLRRLGTDHVDGYRPARVDPSVPTAGLIGNTLLTLARHREVSEQLRILNHNLGYVLLHS